MIRNLFNVPPDAAAGMLGSERPLSTAEAAALKVELTTDPSARGYAGKTDAQALVLGAAGYFTPNPLPQGRVPKPFVTQGELIVLATTMQGRKVAALLQGATIPAGISYLIDTAIPQAAQQESLDTTNTAALAMLDALIAAGFYTTEEKTDFITSPDPAWTPEVWNDSRWTVLFTAGACPQLAEITTARA